MPLLPIKSFTLYTASNPKAHNRSQLDIVRIFKSSWDLLLHLALERKRENQIKLDYNDPTEYNFKFLKQTSQIMTSIKELYFDLRSIFFFEIVTFVKKFRF